MAMTTKKNVNMTAEEATKTIEDATKDILIPDENEDDERENKEDTEVKMTFFEKHPALGKIVKGGTIAFAVGATGYILYSTIKGEKDNSEAIEDVRGLAKKALSIASENGAEIKRLIADNAKPVIESVATEITPEDIKETVSETVSDVTTGAE